MNVRSLVVMAVFVAGCSGVPQVDAGTGGGGGATGGGGGSTGGGGGSTGGGGGSPGGGGGQACSPACGTGRTCCGGLCVNTANDPGHCGGCGVTCSGLTPYCDGACTTPPCTLDAGFCSGGTSCCGASCCGAGQICCDAQGPLSGVPNCFTPTAAEPTCPQGCAPLCVSDRNLKSGITPIDERAVLEQVASLPLSTWRYTADPAAVRHLGPMAQDFRATFGLGDTDRAYNSIDAHGVSLASIKALYRMVQEQQVRLEKLEAENAQLRQSSACVPR